jgi:hypothetical protein
METKAHLCSFLKTEGGRCECVYGTKGAVDRKSLGTTGLASSDCWSGGHFLVVLVRFVRKPYGRPQKNNNWNKFHCHDHEDYVLSNRISAKLLGIREESFSSIYGVWTY